MCSTLQCYLLLWDTDVTQPCCHAQVVRLLRFLAGVMALERRTLVAAYALLLAGLAARLCLPRWVVTHCVPAV